MPLFRRHTERGAPLKAEVLVETATTATGALQVNYTLQWHNKTRSHAPETMWLSNIPAGTTADGWKMDKLGSWIDPLEANLDGSNGQVQNGGGLYGDGGTCTPEGTTCGTHLHAVDRGVTYTAPAGGNAFTARSIDTALLSFGSATPVPTPLSVPDPTGGVHWALVGNIWNTNYPVRSISCELDVVFFFVAVGFVAVVCLLRLLRFSAEPWPIYIHLYPSSHIFIPPVRCLVHSSTNYLHARSLFFFSFIVISAWLVLVSFCRR